MKAQLMAILGVVSLTGMIAPACNADTYTTVTTNEPSPVTETRTTTVESAPLNSYGETRTTTIERAPLSTTTEVREQPVIINERPEKVVVVKKHDHHLIKVGPVKVF